MDTLGSVAVSGVGGKGVSNRQTSWDVGQSSQFFHLPMKMMLPAALVVPVVAAVVDFAVAVVATVATVVDVVFVPGSVHWQEFHR